MLEQPRRTPFKHASHMLCNHGGSVFLHTLPSGRSNLEDPPSISESIGGRVTDYRISEFGVFMRNNMLVPFAEPPAESSELPLERALQQLERSTRVWPLSYANTVLFNMPDEVQLLLKLLTYEHLTESNLAECRQVVYRVHTMVEDRTAPLALVSGMRKTGSKRDEQLRQLWTELENVVLAASTTSPRHREVLDTVQQLRSQRVGSAASSNTANHGVSKLAEGAKADSAGWKDEYDMYKRRLERDKPAQPAEAMTALERRTNSLQSLKQKATGVLGSLAPSAKRPMKFSPGDLLLSVWKQHHRSLAAAYHIEFAGRQEFPDGKAKLYPDLDTGEGAKPTALEM